jgi:hypothetical protein
MDQINNIGLVIRAVAELKSNIESMSVEEATTALTEIETSLTAIETMSEVNQ